MNTNPEKQNILNQAQKDKFLMVLDVPPFLQKLKLGSEKEDIGIKDVSLS